MDLVDKRLQVGGDVAPVGGRISDRLIAFTAALKDALKDSVAEVRMGVGNHAGNL